MERNSEIKITTFTSSAEKEKREVFQKQILPHVQHLRHCAIRWEEELQNEVSNMINVFNATETSISKHKQQNKVLKSENDHLLEQVLYADIYSVIMNSLYESGTSMLVDDHSDDKECMLKQIETLKTENENILKQSDDVKTKL